MADLVNDLGYSTYISGTSKEINDCKTILLYNKEEVSTSVERININAYNIDEVIQQLRDTGNYLELTREDTSNPFEYSMENGKISGFNLIIYISPYEHGIGYTEFLNLQGKYRDLNIYINSTTELGESIFIKIVESLVLSNIQGYRDWIGEECNEYSNALKIYRSIEGGGICPSSYTSHLSSFREGDKESNIWLPGMGVMRENSLHIISIAKDFDADPYNLNFDQEWIGLYTPDDISLYKWKGLKYSISSLTTTNRFGDPIMHTATPSGYVQIPDLSENTYEILGFSGKYAIVTEKGGERSRVWDTFERKFVNLGVNSGKVFIDESDRNYPIIALPVSSYAKNIIELVPDLGNTFYDIETYGKSYYINIIYRKGPWFVFRQGDLLVWSNLRQSITTTWEERNRVLLINDIYLGIISEDREYLTLYTGLGNNWISEKARQSKGGSWGYDSSLGIWKASDDNDLIYDTAYTNKSLKIFKGWIEDNPELMDFRKGAFPTNGYPKVGSIIGSLLGFIFYKNNNRINYI